MNGNSWLKSKNLENNSILRVVCENTKYFIKNKEKSITECNCNKNKKNYLNKIHLLNECNELKEKRTKYKNEIIEILKKRRTFAKCQI